jgi:hypothetical protein
LQTPTLPDLYSDCGGFIQLIFGRRTAFGDLARAEADGQDIPLFLVDK